MPPADNTPPPPSLRPLVLVVDDEPSIRLVARLMLERAGFVVDEAGDAAEAMGRALRSSRRYSVVLLDVSLPDRSGIDVMADLRLAARGAPVVLTSGRAEEDVPEHGAEGYLAKPFSREQLLAAVRAAAALTPQ
ncbi:transcriptional regulator : Two-component response transcriptional regulator with PhoR (Or CreC), regulation of Pi uptake (OmpR family) OS=Phaeospirillum molischianum DSM 120 GN=phoB PE=4 SV=1: Response_reg [Gemmata massiliana]|uniref:Response regulatory domain-containing protein n=1 Tax=Gemmata massiliana TaxID=1210884 RepID=A0A6P2DD34_9BACT|nr:response regulator [Gemmata massiliana]VTR98788.1 transcriptional regulator : Two-component response transcriptional regulator with PhoR (Or CreC), regulation of Pi uptake (OmpR family) OS=Phaeospirillum molischianum DSM 120 GN=phoB PE=4 SV=1: Response_reg [Gemmata massiliana]